MDSAVKESIIKKTTHGNGYSYFTLCGGTLREINSERKSSNTERDAAFPGLVCDGHNDQFQTIFE